MYVGDKNIVDYEYLVKRLDQLNSVITENQLKDPDKQDKKLFEQSLINLGAAQMILELIEKFPATTPTPTK